MSIVTMKALLHNARKNNYAVGAFSVGNMEMVLGSISAAEDLHSPFILQIAEARLKNSPLELMAPMMVSAAKNAKVPVAVHFDHGIHLETIRSALELGFTSVMFDGSSLPLEENCKKTNLACELAKKYGASAEAEIGRVGGSEDGKTKGACQCSDLQEAIHFYESTHVDALAVAIGNAHGNYVQEPHLNFDVLSQIHNAVDVPLVLHGGSGISATDFRKCISLGIHKINIATSNFNSLEHEVRNLYNSTDSTDYFKLSKTMVEGAYESVSRHIKIFMSDGKA